jgi:hypothetical protein
LEPISTIIREVVVPGAIGSSKTNVGSVVIDTRTIRDKISRLARPEVPQGRWKATSVGIIHCAVDCVYVNYFNMEQ